MLIKRGENDVSKGFKNDRLTYHKRAFYKNVEVMLR